jgi:pimeloyl-ACP methyl ester carboxylesterase
MRTALIPLLLLLTTPAFADPDYTREKKWDDEISPGIVVGDPMYLTQKNGHKFLAIYTEAANARMGVVLLHGTGIHPDWGLISTLRQRLPDHGYTTLSIQLPILAVDAKDEDYEPLIPDAVERLQLAVAWLKSKGYRKIAIVSHSFGGRVAIPFLRGGATAVNALASLGAGSNATYDGIKVPVLDLMGANDFPNVMSNAARRKASLKGNAASKQVVIPDTNHFYADQEPAMVTAVKDFLDGVK